MIRVRLRVLLLLVLAGEDGLHAACRHYRAMHGGPSGLGCPTNCNRYTPCLVRPEELVLPEAERKGEAQISPLPDWRAVSIVGAAWANGSAGFLREIARLGDEELLGSRAKPELSLRLLRLFRAGKLALRVTGPLSDGFWVRVTAALAHARWAERAGIPISIVYRSPHDNYDNNESTSDGWTQYFEPVRSDWPREHLVSLSCYSSASVWKLLDAHSGSAHGGTQSGSYAWTWREAVRQRAWRRGLVESGALRLLPRPEFFEAARDFWKANGIERRANGGALDGSVDATVVLGVHLRGTDKACSVGVDRVGPLARAFLCHHRKKGKRVAVFVATDDADMLADFKIALDENVTGGGGGESGGVEAGGVEAGGASTRILYREAIRGSSKWYGRGNSLNPAVHARGKSGTRPRMPGEHSAHLGKDVLTDTLLLSQSDFLIGTVSAVTSYAILLNPRLHERSFIADVEGQPKPSWLLQKCQKGRAGVQSKENFRAAAAPETPLPAPSTAASRNDTFVRVVTPGHCCHWASGHKALWRSSASVRSSAQCAALCLADGSQCAAFSHYTPSTSRGTCALCSRCALSTASGFSRYASWLRAGLPVTPAAPLLTGPALH